MSKPEHKARASWSAVPAALLAVLLLHFPFAAASSPIEDAIYANDLAKLKELLRADPSLIKSESTAGSPLRVAALLGMTQVAEVLLAHGADPNAVDNTGGTPLHAAAVEGTRSTREVVLLLLAKGANINAKDKPNGNSPLHIAAARGTAEIVSLLLARGAAVNATNVARSTPLHDAVERGHRPKKEIVELLVSKSADVNARDVVGYTVLHKLTKLKLGLPWAEIRTGTNSTHAAFRKSMADQMETAAFLIARGADVNAKDDGDSTPLHWAAWADRAEFVDLLLRRGASINAKDRLGRTPLKFAMEVRSAEAVDVLRRRGGTE